MKLTELFIVCLLSLLFIPLIGGISSAEGNELGVETEDYLVLRTSQEAVLQGSLESLPEDEEGDPVEVDVFFRHGLDIVNYTLETSRQEMDEPGDFMARIPVEPDTIYSYKAVAQWNDEEETGEGEHFQTEDFDVMDEEVNVETLPVEEVAADHATLTGEATDLEIEEAEGLFKWRKTEGEGFNETEGQTVYSEEVFEEELKGLETNETYEYKSVLSWDDGSIEGSIKNFTTELSEVFIEDLRPEDGAEGIGTSVELEANFTKNMHEGINLTFYDGSDQKIGTTEEVNGKGAVTWENLDYSETYSWYVVADHPDGTETSEQRSFETTDIEVINDIQDRSRQIEEDISKAEGWLSEHGGEMDTEALENSLNELSDLHREAEESIEEERYYEAEEILDEAEIFQREVNEQLESLEEEREMINPIWIVLIIAIVIIVGVAGAFLFSFEGEAEHRDYNYNPSDDPGTEYEELRKEDRES